LNFFDFAWSTTLQLTKKAPNELKILLHDELKYPYLGRDSKGYVLHLIKPKIVDEKTAIFQGLPFNLQNPTHKKIIWYLFKASVYHLAMHLIHSNFTIYSKWAKGKNVNLSTFVASIVEDAVIKEQLKNVSLWMMPEIAYANTVSYLRMKNVNELFSDISRVMASILMKFNIGKVKGKLEDEVLTDVKAVVSILRKAAKNPTVNERLGAASKIYDALHVYGGEPFEIPSLLYTESHGTNDPYYEERIPGNEEIEKVLPNAVKVLEGKVKNEKSFERAMEQIGGNEAQRNLNAWREHEKSKFKILKNYAEIGKDTAFEDFLFPREDYSEYHRKRELLSSPIRRILQRLRMLKNVGGEDFRKESGIVDLQEAIQVIASQSQRTDIFVREELQTREDAWSILIDASHSLSMFKGEVQGIALCLAEVAKQLILNQNSWGMYAFNNKFYIVKDFSEKYNARVKARIGGLTHGGFTYLPDGITVATQALTKRMEESRVLVIVSDFFPAGYDDIEGKLKDVIRKIERLGIGIIGIGVNSTAVRKYVRPNCVVEHPYDLMKKFTKAFIEYSTS